MVPPDGAHRTCSRPSYPTGSGGTPRLVAVSFPATTFIWPCAVSDFATVRYPPYRPGAAPARRRRVSRPNSGVVQRRRTRIRHYAVTVEAHRPLTSVCHPLRKYPGVNAQCYLRVGKLKDSVRSSEMALETHFPTAIRIISPPPLVNEDEPRTL
ncbi:hypothetical protein KCP74_12520 [Salmonella enterica subsp. enterica]|nr:hypothetical protein KCP74_12520 [Salmonella enterica subsp. enterica]